jgi:hypothetical protein
VKSRREVCITDNQTFANVTALSSQTPQPISFTTNSPSNPPAQPGLRVKRGRRKILDCKRVRPSNSNPGYFKFIVTVQEPDGSEAQVPCYGKTMQDALSRLHWTVQTERAAQLVERNTFMQVLLALGVLVIFGAFALLAQTQDKPLYLAAGFALVLSLIGLAALWLRRLYRAVEEE